MTANQVQEVLAGLSENQLREVPDFARFLQIRQEHDEWRQFSARQLARAYGPNEPEYTEADLKPERSS